MRVIKADKTKLTSRTSPDPSVPPLMTYRNQQEGIKSFIYLCFGFKALGNHEFDNGVQGLMKPFMEQIKCPVLSANIKPDETLSSTFGTAYLPYKILNVGGEKVGVVGYTSRETPALSKPGESLCLVPRLTGMRPFAFWMSFGSCFSASMSLNRNTPEVRGRGERAAAAGGQA